MQHSNKPLPPPNPADRHPTSEAGATQSTRGRAIGALIEQKRFERQWVVILGDSENGKTFMVGMQGYVHSDPRRRRERGTMDEAMELAIEMEVQNVAYVVPPGKTWAIPDFEPDAASELDLYPEIYGPEWSGYRFAILRITVQQEEPLS